MARQLWAASAMVATLLVAACGTDPATGGDEADTADPADAAAVRGR